MHNAKRLIEKPARVGKKLVKQAIGLLPPSPDRLTGKLAKDGGKPVRDVRFRPWPHYPAASLSEWIIEIGPVLRKIFMTGAEGLPQKLALEFAEKWAEFCGTRHALLLPHGTDALRIALAATLDHDGMEYGGEVIVPNLTFIASASAALDRRFGVALVDVDPETLNIDPARVEEAIIPGKTRAIVAVHLFGQPADMVKLREVAARHSLVLIEDAAQAHGAIHELGMAGSLGDVAAFSFQSSKNMSSGEGGVMTTNDPEVFERAYGLYNVGRSRIGTQRWGHATLGWNIRPTEYVAAVLLHRLRRLEQEQQSRHQRFISLRDKLADIPCVQPLSIGPGVIRHAVYWFVVRYHPDECGGLSFKDFLDAINAEGVPLYPGYDLTLAQQPAIQRLAERHPNYLRVLPTPVADEVVGKTAFLPHPVFLGGESDMEEVAAAFRKVQAKYAGSGTRVKRPVTIKRPESVPVTILVKDAAFKPLRVGIIGMGAMGQQHAAAIKRNSRLSLTAVSDVQAQIGKEMAASLGAKWFATGDKLIHSRESDVVVIATPHWQHPSLAISALQAGLHVVCEKPIAVTVSEADKILQAANTSSGKFAVVYQSRFEPAYRYARKLLESGELGQLYRCSIVESAWRSQNYYQSSPWRGTWQGEGGGVLLNQAPHILDRYVWLCGMPTSVLARCDTTTHNIEVEDTASAILLHHNGAHGYIHVSTVECPAVSRIVISCDRGRLTIENGKVQVVRLCDSIREKTITDTRLMGELKNETFDASFSSLSFQEQLDAFYQNLLASINDNAELLSPGQDGLNSVELANAMILSSKEAKTIFLPVNRSEYSLLMEEMMNPMAQAI